MWDGSKRNYYNSGFTVVKPTPLSIRIYRMMQNVSSTSPGINDQMALNNVIFVGLRGQKISVALLDRHVYLCGMTYFETMHRLLPRADDPCGSVDKMNCSVLVVHNNWIYTLEAKIYRFREHLMWLYDGEDQYYSSETRNYLTYSNPVPTKSQLAHMYRRQLSDLKTALSVGYLLNRTVILPRFNCGNVVQCPLNSLIRIRTFDALFSKRYRESSFLHHPRVPDAVKQSVSDHELISHTTRSLHTYNVNIVKNDDIIKLFRNSKHKVINLGILEGIEVTFKNSSAGTTLNERMRKAFKRANYRQRTR